MDTALEASSAPSDLTGADVTVAPSREDPLVRRFSAVVGGPAGDRIRGGRHGWWTAARVLVVLAMVALSFGVVEKQHCRAQGWTSPDQFFHACYSDLPLLYETSGIARGVNPYAAGAPAGALGQPVLTGLLSWAVGTVTPHGSMIERDRTYFDISTGVIALLVLALVLLTVASTGRRRPWDASLVALSPLLALSALVSFDMLGIALAAAALLLWGRSRPLVAGVLLGLAITARTYPLVLLLVLALLALRTGRWRAWLITAAAAFVTVVVVLAPFLASNSEAVKASYRTWWHAGASYGSIWLLPLALPSDPRPRWVARLGLDPTQLDAGTVTTLTLLGIVLAVAVGFLMTLGTERRPRVAQVAFVVLAIVVMTGKAWPVQASLWLLPLAALARPRWRDHLIWAGCEATYFVGVWLYVAGQTTANRGLPGSWYSVLVVLRVAGLLWLVCLVVRDARRPELDVVREAGYDDPVGGPFAGAEDSVVVRFGDERDDDFEDLEDLEDRDELDGTAGYDEPVDDDSPGAGPSRYP
ncbi:glycosyltransferase family 87 protein [Angustibacter sp. McL0619]|uniref:glycosyltransferase family 87 protein n=1 Tax=Angustibacter sp. McL0619 TaxID=3415676 RepID=UPI003CF06FCE